MNERSQDILARAEFRLKQYNCGDSFEYIYIFYLVDSLHFNHLRSEFSLFFGKVFLSTSKKSGSKQTEYKNAFSFIFWHLVLLTGGVRTAIIIIIVSGTTLRSFGTSFAWVLSA